MNSSFNNKYFLRNSPSYSNTILALNGFSFQFLSIRFSKKWSLLWLNVNTFSDLTNFCEKKEPEPFTSRTKKPVFQIAKYIFVPVLYFKTFSLLYLMFFSVALLFLFHGFVLQILSEEIF